MTLLADHLSANSKNIFSAVAAKLKRPFTFREEKQLVLQYEVAFQNGLDCGGGYVKLLSSAKDLDLRQLTDKTPYTIMFGPDKCGSDSKFHLIFRHVHPETGAIEEKHCKKVEGKGRGVLEEIFKDKKVANLNCKLLKNDLNFINLFSGSLAAACCEARQLLRSLHRPHPGQWDQL